ncbi:MAG: glycosyltransferase family 1 protein [Microcystis aeruginosa Ma_AC_P_19900807_S299]|nr:MAG: glycosyltransferase family 1 protein [Microcystis aeruginosa Ma_AC_P_19900807_S299]
MRIALFTETFLPKIDGIVTRLKHTVEHLQRLGHQVLVFSPDGGLKEYKGAKIHGVTGIPLPLYPELKMAFPRPSVGQALERFKPDIIHVVNPAILGVGGIYFAKTMNIPLVASYHTHLPQYLQHYGLGSLEGLQELSSRGIEKVELWQRGVDTELFQPHLKSPAMRLKLSQNNPDSPLLLYVGRVSAEKEIDRIKPVLEAIPEARFAIVGDGPHREALTSHFADTNTHFVGYLQGLELASAFASADAFLFPSRTETLGLVLLESMAAGCPVVAANSGGIPDIVTDGVNGHLFDPRDEKGLISATQRLLTAKAEREELRRNARLEAEKWAWQAATKQLLNYYHRVLNNNSVAFAA